MRLSLLGIFICFMVSMTQLVSIHTSQVGKYYPYERDALIPLRDSLNSTLNLHSNWTGPPCYGDKSKWVGIACSDWHVVEIVLEGIQLTGSLPPSFPQSITLLRKLNLANNSLVGPLPNLTNLVNLQFIFLSHNRLSGSIPLGLVKLPALAGLELQENRLTGHIPPFDQPSLRNFNVSGNLLEGSVPETPTLQKFSKSSYDHNLELCGKPLDGPCPVVPPAPPVEPSAPPNPSHPVPSKGKNKTLKAWIITLVIVAAVSVPLLVMLVFLCYQRRHGKGTKGEHSGEDFVETVEKKKQSAGSTEDTERALDLEFFDKERATFDLDDLLRSSAELLGKGNLGITYKARLDTRSTVTVKRLKETNVLSKKEFLQGMQLLGKMRHDNLVELISLYYSKDEKLVIYEYIPHGSLYHLLHDNRGERRVVALNWRRRLSIVEGIAKGLTYLHECLPSHSVPHANLKSSNILIIYNNQNYQPKLTDFGFLPFLPRRYSEKLSIRMSPEFSQNKKLTHKIDVYCFGIVLLEIITGLSPGEFSKGNDDTTGDLSDQVRAAVSHEWSTDILDMELLSAKDGHDEMLHLIEIALECTAMEPEDRPNMTEVLRRIEKIDKGRDT